MPKKKIINTAFLKMAQAPLKPSHNWLRYWDQPLPSPDHRSREGLGLHQKA
jgi:hypothetical protein